MDANEARQKLSVRQMGEKTIGFVKQKVLGFDPSYRYVHQPDGLIDRARRLISPATAYVENEPGVLEWIRNGLPTHRGTTQYVRGLFPPIAWLPRYNASWLLGDVVAGITIGLVVVPQAMAYAVLAGLDPAYGLYTSFTGAVLYWIFGTSKDIVIGTTAVGSLLVGQVVTRVQSHNTEATFSNEEIAHTLSLLSGAVLLFLGLLRLGWVIEFIPYIPISAFVTAASITIMSTQIPTALGLPGVNSGDPPYLNLYHSITNLQNMTIDAAIGVTSIVLLFAIKVFCSRMEQRSPVHKRKWSLLSSLRLTFVIVLFTLIGYIVHRGRDSEKFQLVGHIDRGLREIGIPQLNVEAVKHILPQLPAVVIILVIEHIAIAKSMGRLYNYSICPSQEILALGGANMLSPFVGGYVCTGSFGASAVLSKSGVRTPLAGVFSAMILILALYALTGAFYYIPKAALAGLIIHAVCNLITPPKKVYSYWQLSPLDLLIWVACVILALFRSLEWSIYAGVVLSLVLLLVRAARTRGHFLGIVRTKRVNEDKSDELLSSTVVNSTETKVLDRTVFVRMDEKGASNPAIRVESPYPGVFIYRLSEGYSYINQAFHMETLLRYVSDHTRRLSDEDIERASDRLWNDPGPRSYKNDEDNAIPFLRAIVLDFSSVNNVDVTSLQGLIDLRNSLDRYSAPDTVEWHFSNVYNRWTRRALATAGFGYPTKQNPSALQRWKPIYSIAETLMDDGFDFPSGSSDSQSCARSDQESGASFSTTHWTGEVASKSGFAAVSGVDRPFFHIDLRDAVEAAVQGAQTKDKALRSFT